MESWPITWTLKDEIGISRSPQDQKTKMIKHNHLNGHSVMKTLFYIRVCIHVCVHSFECVCVCRSSYAYVCIHVCVSQSVIMCMGVNVCVRAWMCICVQYMIVYTWVYQCMWTYLLICFAWDSMYDCVSITMYDLSMIVCAYVLTRLL